MYYHYCFIFMNTKVVYGIGSILFLIGFIFYLMNSSYFAPNSYLPDADNSYKKTGLISSTLYHYGPKSQIANAFLSSSQQAYASSKPIPSNYENLTVSVKSVNVIPTNNVPILQIAFDVHNPNKGAAILETLSYNVYLHNVRLVSADIGSAPQGFIDSLSSVYPIIGNQTITLKDKHPITSDGSSLFNAIGTLNSNSTLFKGSIPKSFVINGTFSTTLDRGTQSQSSEIPFSLKYPVK